MTRGTRHFILNAENKKNYVSLRLHEDRIKLLLTMKNTSSRCIFDLSSVHDGPLLWCMAGTHGNEHDGIWALEHIAEEIETLGIELKGRFLATRGNMAALEVHKRTLDLDLNRSWRTKHLQEVQLTDIYSTSEYYEMREILDIVNEIDVTEYSSSCFHGLTQHLCTEWTICSSYRHLTRRAPRSLKSTNHLWLK